MFFTFIAHAQKWHPELFNAGKLPALQRHRIIALINIVQPYCPVVGWRRQHAVSTSAYLGLSSVSSHLVRLSNVLSQDFELVIRSVHCHWLYLVSCWCDLAWSTVSVTIVFPFTFLSQNVLSRICNITRMWVQPTKGRMTARDGQFR